MPGRLLARRRRRTVVSAAFAAVLAAAVAGCSADPAPYDPPPPDGNPPAVVDGHPLRAFIEESWWNTQLPADAPGNARADVILQYMRTADEAGDGCLRLAGAGGNSWGQPVYWSKPDDPTFDVAVGGPVNPPELRDLRIPRSADAADNNDGSMTIFDVDRGYTVAFTNAEYDAGADTWSAAGATVTYLDSNGLDERTGQSSDPRNLGSHRGNNGAVMMARIDEVAAGYIGHVLKVASGPEVSKRYVFPMVGSDGSSRDPAAPPQGLRFRIKPSVDLGSLDLGPQALVIATALQDFGFYIGDSSGVTALKLEDTRSEGRGQLWETSATALCGLPFTGDFWEVLPEGYQPPGSTSTAG